MFCEYITAATASKPAGVDRNTVNYYYNKIRRILLSKSLREGGVQTGEFELGEHILEQSASAGNGGCGAAGKTPVFGLLKRGGKVL
jgi:transposase